MTGLMETVESRRQAFHEFHSPLGSRQRRAGFPHSHSSDDRRESGNQKAGFPLSRLRLERGREAQTKANRCGGRAYALPPQRSGTRTERRESQKGVILRQVASGSCLLERNFTVRLILGLEYACPSLSDGNTSPAGAIHGDLAPTAPRKMRGCGEADVRASQDLDRTLPRGPLMISLFLKSPARS